MNSQSLLDEMVNEDSVRILKAAIPYLHFCKISGTAKHL